MERFVGTNCYFLAEEGAREALGWEGYAGRVDEALSKCAALGLKVVRAWAFNDDPSNPVAIQPRPGELSEAGLAGVDLALEAAARHGVQLILSLGNFWEDYGGVPQYLRWHGLDPTDTDRFFIEPAVRGHYGDHIEALLRRVNPRTGLAWGDDPTVWGWELMNEPRGGAAMGEWVAELGPRVRAAAPGGRLLTGGEGRDDGFVETLPLVDVASIHLYPEEWEWDDVCEPGVHWIVDHADLAAAAGRPLLIGEFGLDNGGLPLSERRRIYRRWFEVAREHPAVVGVCSWSFSTDERPDDWDSFSWTWRDGTDAADDGNRYAALHSEEAARWAARSER